MKYDRVENERYFLALGRFVNTFAQVEQAMFDHIVKLAGIDPALGPVFFSGLRTENAASTAKKVHEALGTIADPSLLIALDRLSNINRIRNDILHHGASQNSANPGEWLVTPRRRAATAEKLQELRVSPKIIDDMSFDLEMIILILMTAPAEYIAPTGEGPFRKPRQFAPLPQLESARSR